MSNFLRSEMPILKATELCKSFGHVKAVNGIAFEVDQGEIMGLIGPDGSGKSTTLRMLAGLLAPDSGNSTICEADVMIDPDKAKSMLGYMPQHFALYSDLTVGENLQFFADMYLVGKNERVERLERLYKFSRLQPYTKRLSGQLSGGMQKKLALMCCMIHTPKLLLLDEPTTGVDPLSRRELWDILYAFADQGVSIVVSTPYMDEAERCHKVGLMHQGIFMAYGAPKQLSTRMEGRILSAKTANPGNEISKLSGHKAIARMYPVGLSINVILKDSQDAREVAEYAAGWINLAPQRPRFEDLFLDLIGDDGIGTGGQS